MANLNPNASYTVSVPRTAPIQRKNIPKNWLAELAILCSPTDKKEFFKERFQIHAGPQSTYKVKANLLEGLKEIYIRMSEKGEKALNESTKAGIAAKLLEGAENCTPGFHDRVNDTLAAFYLPKTMNDFLYRMRCSIVESTARAKTDDVHEHNRFFTVASTMEVDSTTKGYGIAPLNWDDVYVGNIPDAEITTALKNAFDKKYTPFSIISSLQEDLKGILFSNFEYKGLNQDPGYTIGEYGKFISYFEEVFGKENVSSTDFLILDDDSKVVDLNWDKINQTLIQTLAEKHIQFRDDELHLLNTIFSEEFVAKEPSYLKDENPGYVINLLKLVTDPIKQYTVISTYVNQLDSNKRNEALIEINSALKNPTLAAQLINNVGDIKRIDPLFDTKQKTKLYEQLKDKLPSLIKNAKELNEVLAMLNAEQRVFLYNALKEKIPSFIQDAADLLPPAYLTEEQRSELCKSIGDKLFHKDFIKNKADFVARLRFIEGTAIPLDIQFKLITEYINQYSEPNKDPLETLLDLELSNKDLLALVADHAINHFNLEPLFATNETGNLLEQRLYNKKCPPLLPQIIGSLNEEQQTQILSHTNSFGMNAIQVAAGYYPESMPSLLELLQKLPVKTQASVLMHKSEDGLYGYNALALSIRQWDAYSCNTAFIPLLNHIEKYLSIEDQTKILVNYQAGRGVQRIINITKKDNELEPLLLLLSKLPLKTQGIIFDKSWLPNALLYAINEKPNLVPSLLVELSNSPLSHQVELLSSLFSPGYKSMFDTDALVRVARDTPELLKPLITKIRELPAEESAKILPNINWTDLFTKVISESKDNVDAVNYIYAEIANLSKEQQHQILFPLNNEAAHWDNALLCALVYQSQLAGDILEVLKELPLDSQGKVLKQIWPGSNALTGNNALMLALDHKPQMVDSLWAEIQNLLPEDRKAILCQRNNSQDTVLTLAAKKSYPIEPFLEAINQLEEPETLAKLLKEPEGLNPLLCAAAWSPQAVTPLLKEMEKLSSEDQKLIFTQVNTGKNALAWALELQPDVAPLIIQHIRKLPEDLQQPIFNQIELGQKELLKLNPHFEHLKEIKGSRLLSDKFANQSYTDKQKIIKAQLTKFLFSLVRNEAEEDSETISNDFKKLIHAANKHRNIFHFSNEMATSCKDLLEKLSHIGLEEKMKLKEALKLDVEDINDPQKFKDALEKCAVKLDKEKKFEKVDFNRAPGSKGIN